MIRRSNYTLRLLSVLTMGVALGGVGCKKKKKAIPPAATPVSLAQCLDTPNDKRVAVEGFIHLSFVMACVDTCDVDLMPRKGARGGPRAVVTLPSVSSGGKNGMVSPSDGFKPGDLKLYDSAGKRIPFGQPVRLSGKRSATGEGCRIKVDRVDPITSVTTPLMTAKAKPVPLAGLCQAHKNGELVRVKGFGKLAGALSCVGDCDFQLHEDARLTGPGLKVEVPPGKAPNHVRVDPPSLVGRDGKVLSLARPLVVEGVLEKALGDETTGNGKGKAKPTCSIKAERLWQGKSIGSVRPPLGSATGGPSYRRLTNAAGGFRIDWPGKLVMESMKLLTVKGTLVAHLAMARSQSTACGGPRGQCGFAVMHYKVTPKLVGSRTSKQVLVDMLNGMLTKQRTKAISTQHVTFQGHPALRYKAQGAGPPPTGKALSQGLMLLTPTRAYSVQAFSDPAHAGAVEIKQVLSSFALLPAAAAAQKP